MPVVLSLQPDSGYDVGTVELTYTGINFTDVRLSDA